MLEMELAPEQRATAVNLIKQKVILQYASIDNTDIRYTKPGSFTEQYVGETFIRLPFACGSVCVTFSDKDIIKAVRDIKEGILYDSGKLDEFLDSLDAIEPEEAP